MGEFYCKTIKSNSWTYVKPIKNNYSNLTVVYEQVKNVGKPHGEFFTNCGTLLSTKRSTFTGRHDKSNDWIKFQPLALLRLLKFITMVETMVVSIFSNYGKFIYKV